jgi:PilZ domain
MLTVTEKKVIQEKAVTDFAGDRRSKKRFGLDLPLKYKIVKNYLVTGGGTGTTVDMSSGGIAFTTTETFRIGAHIELSVNWPVLLNGDCAMKLVIEGRVVRSDTQLTAIRMERYEFRTQARSEARPAPALTMAAS